MWIDWINSCFFFIVVVVWLIVVHLLLMLPSLVFIFALKAPPIEHSCLVSLLCSKAFKSSTKVILYKSFEFFKEEIVASYF